MMQRRSYGPEGYIRASFSTSSYKTKKAQMILKDLFGEPGGNRTRDHRIKSAMLYQLSYRPTSNSF